MTVTRAVCILLFVVWVNTRLFVKCGTSLTVSGRGPGMLYPLESESRHIQLLDGMWNFRADRSDCRCEGLMQKWYLKQLSEVHCLLELYQTYMYISRHTGVNYRD